jgi:beta-lactamase regulating signal transducer with metallopeptidase domain
MRSDHAPPEPFALDDASERRPTRRRTEARSPRNLWLTVFSAALAAVLIPTVWFVQQDDFRRRSEEKTRQFEADLKKRTDETLGRSVSRTRP